MTLTTINNYTKVLLTPRGCYATIRVAEDNEHQHVYRLGDFDFDQAAGPMEDPAAPGHTLMVSINVGKDTVTFRRVSPGGVEISEVAFGRWLADNGLAIHPLYALLRISEEYGGY